MNAADAGGFGLLAILVMGATTFLMRAAGFWLMGHVPLTRRTQRMLEALPGSIVAATVLPIVAKSGPPAFLAISVAAAIMILLRNELCAVAAGVVAGALARGAGF